MPELVTINDHNWTDHVEHVGPEGEYRAKGLIPRDFRVQYHGCVAQAEPFPDELLIDEAEWDERIAEQVAKQSSMEDIRNFGMDGQQIPSLDQDGIGYCWIHSGTNCMKIGRAISGEPYVPLSAFMAGSIIKNYRDEGGNGIDGVKFFATKGVCSEKYWPAQARNPKYDTPEMWANAALHKALRWYDLSPNASTRRKQVASCLLRNIPVIGDFNWWGHSVMMIRLVSRTETNIWNSWSDSWSVKGIGKLQGSKAWPDNAVALNVESAAAA